MNENITKSVGMICVTAIIITGLFIDAEKTLEITALLFFSWLMLG